VHLSGAIQLWQVHFVFDQNGLFSKLGVDIFFPTIGQAVVHYLLRHPVVWHDWDDDKKSEGIGA
jgi:hypothetical protein